MMLSEFHQALGARFTAVNGVEAVADYGDHPTEHAVLHGTAGVLDLSLRSRLCLTGADRVRFLHGQVTNDIKSLKVSEGCYAALVTAKGRMQSDLNVFALSDELLLDFEPGLTETVSKRLETYIVADDVQVVDISANYGLLSVQGPKGEEVVRKLGIFQELPTTTLHFSKLMNPALGEVYLVNHARVGTIGFDLFVPVESMRTLADRLVSASREVGGRPCGWDPFELARIEAGIPRFGLDMDDSNFPQEAGIEALAVSYSKGCYIGQEVLNRIHTQGHINRELRGLRLADDLKRLPRKGDKLLYEGKEVGWTTSAAASPLLKANIALGYVRKEANQLGKELVLQSEEGTSRACVVQLPF